MVTTLEQLYRTHQKSFRFKLLSGKLDGQHIVSWIYMLEDENIIPYFSGGELIVTTAARMSRDSRWLQKLVEQLIARKAAGLIVNTGKYVMQIPEEVIDLCKRNHFPLLTMPWEVQITVMTQTLCMTIMNNQQEILLHDQAVRDAILTPEAEVSYRDALSRYYDLDRDFTILAVHARNRQEGLEDTYFQPSQDMAFRLERKIRALRSKESPDLHICWVQLEHLQLIMVNRIVPGILQSLTEILTEVYSSIRFSHEVFIGVGTTQMGIQGLSDSYYDALTALRYAKAQHQSIAHFSRMGYARLLLSSRRDSIPTRYAREVLAPLLDRGAKGAELIDLLDVYIRNDRSLEATAGELFLHRNTVNYRVNKLRDLLGSPLKTAEDLIPYRLAIDILRLQR